jgi:hypothetical protein
MNDCITVLWAFACSQLPSGWSKRYLHKRVNTNPQTKEEYLVELPLFTLRTPGSNRSRKMRTRGRNLKPASALVNNFHSMQRSFSTCDQPVRIVGAICSLCLSQRAGFMYS